MEILIFDYVYMKGGVTRHMLPHLSGVPHLDLNRPLEKFDLLLRVFRLKRRKIPRNPGSNPEPRTRNLEPEPVVS